MTKFITILISCGLALAVAVRAAEPEQEDAKKKPAPKSKPVQRQQLAPKQQRMNKPQVQSVQTKHLDRVPHSNAKIKDTSVPKHQVQTLPAVQSNKVRKTKQEFQTNNNQQQLQTNNQQLQTNKPNKLNKQTIQKIRSQHVNFHAKPNTSVASMKFNQNYQNTAAQNWNGANYQVFKSYHPQWHDQGWWKSHHRRLSLISGGWYFWDGGYWYPAWGYDEGAAYYPYDGPIYSGPSARPFDQVVADVQASLQEQGYYKGEVDGLLGPLTRQALAEYQSAQGLYTTETIDQPTLAALGLG